MDSLRTVDRVRPVAGFGGGKKQIVRHVIAAIVAVPHKVDAERFVGMGGVFLRHRLAAKAETIIQTLRTTS